MNRSELEALDRHITGDGEDETNADLYAAAMETASIQGLIERLEDAVVKLADLWSKSANVDQRARLAAKIDGVKLALSYAREELS